MVVLVVAVVTEMKGDALDRSRHDRQLEGRARPPEPPARLRPFRRGAGPPEDRRVRSGTGRGAAEDEIPEGTEGEENLAHENGCERATGHGNS